MAALADILKINFDKKTFLDFENYANGIEPRPNNPLATFSAFPEKYQPGAKPYDLLVYDVDRQKCLIFTSDKVDPRLLEFYLPKEGKVKFVVHPINLDHPTMLHINEIKQLAGSTILASPTSSTRTVFVLNQDNLPTHCLKPHADLFITRWRRHMEKRKVMQAIAITKILEKTKAFKEDKTLAYFPESIGVVYGKDQKEDWGYIVREMDSSPKLDQKRSYIPLNSLYMPNKKNPDDDPYLVQIINKHKKDPDKFIKELLTNLIDGWVKVYLETGVLLEPHGQNVIVEFSEDEKDLIRFSHRDFDCEVNQDIAKANGFDIHELYENNLFSTNGDKYTPKGAHLSIIYDNSFKVVLEKISALAETKYGIKKNELRAYIKNYMQTKHNDFLKHFPENEKCYNWQKMPDGTKVIIEKKDEKPTWR
jgi:siderophore synthetase component